MPNRNSVANDTPAIAMNGNLEVLADYPAFQFVRTPEFARFKHGSVFAVPFKTRRGDVLHKRFSLGSVVGYAVECADDPLANLERAKERGEKLHWANAMASVISDTPDAKRTVFVLNFGDTITFEGIVFRLDPDHNDNVKLVEVGRNND